MKIPELNIVPGEETNECDKTLIILIQGLINNTFLYFRFHYLIQIHKTSYFLKCGISGKV